MAFELCYANNDIEFIYCLWNVHGVDVVEFNEIGSTERVRAATAEEVARFSIRAQWRYPRADRLDVPESDEQIKKRLAERWSLAHGGANHCCDLTCENHREHMAALGVIVD